MIQCRFEININGTYTEVFPDYSELTLAVSKEDIREKKEISSFLKFSRAEFELMNAYKDNQQEIELKIYENGVFSYDAFIKLQSEEYNYNVNYNYKYCKLAIYIDSRYKILYSKYKQKSNILTGVGTTIKVTYTSFFDKIFQDYSGTSTPTSITNYATCSTSSFLPDIWVSTKTYRTPAGIGGGDYQGSNDNFVSSGSTVYRSLQDNNTGKAITDPLWWIVVVDYQGYAQQQLDFPYTGYVRSYTQHLYYKASCTQDTFDLEFNKNFRIYDLLKRLVQLIDSSILFTETAGDNDFCKYFNVDETYLNNLFIGSSGNIRNSLAEELTVINYDRSIFDLLADLKKKFNVDWKINDNNYFQLLRSDLPQYQLFDLSDKKGYTLVNYADTKSVNLETWQLKSSNNDDFTSGSIAYESKDGESITHDLTAYCNDVDWLLKGTANVPEDSLCMMCCNSSNYIIEYDGEVNGRMQAVVLVNTHQLINRPYNFGTVNGLLTDLTVLELRELKPITFKINESRYMRVDGIVLTEISSLLNVDCYIKSITKKINSEYAEIVVNFK